MGSAQSTSCATLSASCAEGSAGSAQSTSFAISSASCAARSGKCHVEPALTALSNETVTVLDIGLYRVPIENKRRMILHDFVGLRVRFGDGSIFKIRAEKFGSPEGISVKKSGPEERWDTDDVQMKHRAEELEGCRDIRMEVLLAILTEPSPNYSLMIDNCWRYADTTFKQVIRKFLETPSLTPDRRSYLASFLNIPPPPMPVYVIISQVLKIAQGLMFSIFWHIAKGLVIEEAILFWLVLYSWGGVYWFILLYEIAAFVMYATSFKAIKEWWTSAGKAIKAWLLRLRRPLQRQAQGLPPM